MDPVLRELLLERLETAPLNPEAKRVITLAADSGDTRASTQRATPVWLKSVTVEGFRGIGPQATLELEPAPGLTVVVGRNGSGKSSFAEGLELLMTGQLKRWEKRPKAWSETWQCLHHEGPTKLTANLQLEGRQSVTLEQTWPHGAGYGDQSDRARADALLHEHGWARDLPSFRPFLAYAELATMFDTLSSLYDALTPVLGLADLDEVAGKLGQVRLQYDNQRKQSNGAREDLLRRLDPHDERAALVAGILNVRKPNLQALEQLLQDTPEYTEELAQLRRLAGMTFPTDQDVTEAFRQYKVAERAHKDAAQTDAARATNLAALLRRALAVKDPDKLTDDCPVCGTPDVLDDAWAASATEQVEQLEQQAAALTQATADLNVAKRRIEQFGVAEPTQQTVLEHLAQLRQRSAQANAELTQRGAAWQELAATLKRWLEDAKEVEQRAATLAALKDAEKWVKSATDALRAERFAPISDQAIANWRELRQGSSVDLREITLKKIGRGGRADFDVRADEKDANALGVMSQGELLALSVSVFLPRAGLDESPFRFAVIDDPVQAMDPAKVDGLAKVLHTAARTRQIVVFTHDDRLPEAIRRLRLDATMLHVDRRARSAVAVQTSRSPVQRYLDGARGYARSDRLPPEVQARVVPMFCRNAVEAAAANLIRKRAAEDGTDLAEVDEQIAEARSLRETLALVLFGDAGRQGEVGREITHRHGATAASLVTELNRDAGPFDPDTVRQLPDATKSLIADLSS